MNKIKIKLHLVGLFLLMSVCLNTTLNAQTPADDPILIGGSGPGGGVAPAGDGSPVVPFDGGMSLILAASGIGYATKKIKMGKFNLQN